MSSEAPVTVRPEAFTFVGFDARRIAELAEQVRAAAGIDRPLRLEIDESTTQQRVEVRAVDPAVELFVQGAAFEHPQRPRQLGEERVVENLARVLFRVADRLDPAFGEPPPEPDLDIRSKVAWETYAVGRAHRAGLGGREPHRRYLFRHRHGFTDAADAAFDHLWRAERLTWDQVQAASREASGG